MMFSPIGYQQILYYTLIKYMLRVVDILIQLFYALNNNLDSESVIEKLT